MGVINKTGLGNLCVFLALLISVACQQQTPAPENNDFSYLEPESTKKPIAFKEEDSSSASIGLSDKDYACSESSTNLVGVLNRIEYFGPPGYGKTPAKDKSLEGIVLRMSKEIEVNCGRNGKVIAREILLEIPKDMTYEYLLGGNIVAIGQLESTGSTSGILPLKMKVLRLQSVQLSLQ